MRQLSDQLYDKFKLASGETIPVEDLYERFNREIAIKIACNAGNTRCLDDAFAQVQRFANEDEPVPNGLESVLFCNAFRGTARTVEFVALFKKLQESKDSTLRSRLISALGCSDDVVVLRDYLESSLVTNSEVTYTQAERRAVLSAVLNSKSGLQVVTDFLKVYELEALATLGYGSLEDLINVPARTIKTKDQFAIFANYLSTMDHLEEETLARIFKIMRDNMLVQQQPGNVRIMQLLRKILDVENEVENQLRLPTSSSPQRYQIHLDARNIQTGEREYTGEIQIDVLIKQSTDHIMFHSKGQVITDFKVWNKSDMKEIPAFYSLYPETDTITVYLGSDLPADSEIVVNIKYSTALRDPTADGYGFYQSSYQTESGETRYFASTQFEPSRARFAFPHYDEPSFKAVFELKITHDVSRHAISNTFGDPVDK